MGIPSKKRIFFVFFGACFCPNFLDNEKGGAVQHKPKTKSSKIKSEISYTQERVTRFLEILIKFRENI